MLGDSLGCSIVIFLCRLPLTAVAPAVQLFRRADFQTQRNEMKPKNFSAGFLGFFRDRISSRNRMPRLFASLVTVALGVFGSAGVARAQADYAVLYPFTGFPDGGYPFVALIQATDGNFYGTTAFGGASGCTYCGTVFQMRPDGTVTILHAFTGIPDGESPRAALIRGTDGNLYGTTAYGGGSPSCALGCGTVFRLALAALPF